MTTDRSDGPFVEALLAKLNRAEKLAQLQITFAMTAEGCADVARAGIGALFWPMGAAATNAVQKAAVEESAHGIPLLIGLDVIHGQRTIFPIPLAQASSNSTAAWPRRRSLWSSLRAPR